MSKDYPGGVRPRVKRLGWIGLVTGALLLPIHESLVAEGSGEPVVCPPVLCFSGVQTPASHLIRQTHYADGKWVAVGDRGTVLVSTDGKVWEDHSLGVPHNLNDVHFANGRWVLVGQDGILRASSDGESWDEQVIFSQTVEQTISAVVYADDQWIAVGDVTLVIRSVDGIHWDRIQGPVSGAWLEQLHYADGLWVAPATTGLIFTSRNGVDWEGKQGPAVGDQFDVHYDGERWVIVGRTGIADASSEALVVCSKPWSPDVGLLEWELIDIDYPTTLLGVEYVNGRWYAAGKDGALLSSCDARNWDPIHSGMNRLFYGVSQGNDQVLVSGDDGVLLCSSDQQESLFTGAWTVCDTAVMGLSAPGQNVAAFGVSVIKEDGGIIAFHDDGRPGGTGLNLTRRELTSSSATDVCDQTWTSPDYVYSPRGTNDAVPKVVVKDGTYHLWIGSNNVNYATSSDGKVWAHQGNVNLPFVNYSILPRDDGFVAWYSSGGNGYRLATSTDGVMWDDEGQVFFRDVTANEVTQNLHVVLSDGLYHMIHVSFKTGDTRGRFDYAISEDGIKWCRKGRLSGFEHLPFNMTSPALLLDQGRARLWFHGDNTGSIYYAESALFVDDEPPVITLNGTSPMTLECGVDTYGEPGAVAVDAVDGEVPVMIGGDIVDSTEPRDYQVTYDAVDAAGNEAEQRIRVVTVEDTIAPEITLNGSADMVLECGVDSYTEEGAVAIDACDPDVEVIIGGDVVDPARPARYEVTYDATDAAGIDAMQVKRVVIVKDTLAPVITLNGNNPQTVECSDPYVEEGAKAFDLCEGDLTPRIIIDSSEVNTGRPGDYNVYYTVADTAGNEATEVRTVEVVDTTAPLITVTGAPSVVVLQGDAYDEEGATVLDSCDPTVSVVIGGDVVDSSVIGVYVVTYNSVDSEGNRAIERSREVTVIPRFAAINGLFGCVDLRVEKEASVTGDAASARNVALHSLSLIEGDVVNVLGPVELKSEASVGGGVDAGGRVKVGDGGTIGLDVVSAVQIELKKNAVVGGDAISGGEVKLGRGASVGGIVAENVAVTPLADIPLPVLAIGTSGPDIIVEKNGTAALTPGGYSRLSVEQGAAVTMPSGRYTFSEIAVDRGSVLTLDLRGGDIFVQVVGDVDFDGTEMRLTGGAADQVLFQVQGEVVNLGTTVGENNNNESSSSDDDLFVTGLYVGTYLVPNGKLTLEKGGVLNGAAYGEVVVLKQNAIVVANPAVGLLVDAASEWLGMSACALGPDEDSSDSGSSLFLPIGGDSGGSEKITGEGGTSASGSESESSGDQSLEQKGKGKGKGKSK